MAIRKCVTLNVNKDFYDRVFQRERLKYAARIGMPIEKFTNTKFTAFLAKNQVTFKLPKLQGSSLPFKKKRGFICSI